MSFFHTVVPVGLQFTNKMSKLLNLLLVSVLLYSTDFITADQYKNNVQCIEKNGCETNPNPPDNFDFVVSVFSSNIGISYVSYGVITSSTTVMVPAHVVAGFTKFEVSQIVATTCAQTPIEPLIQPERVLVHKDYVSDIMRGHLTYNVALLIFPDGTFSSDRIAPVNFDPNCLCKNLIGSTGITSSCINSENSKREVRIVDYEEAANQYPNVHTTSALLYTKIEDSPDKCAGVAGSFLMVNGYLKGIRSYCRRECDTNKYTAFFCVLSQPYLFTDPDQVTVSLEVANDELLQAGIEKRLYVSRLLMMYGAVGECYNF